MSISGLVAHTDPNKLGRVKTAITTCPGTDIHAATDDGIFVVTVDLKDDNKAADTVMDFRHIDGVLSTPIVYHNIETDILEEELTS